MKKFGLALMTLAVPMAAFAGDPQLVCKTKVTTLVQPLSGTLDKPAPATTEVCESRLVKDFSMNPDINAQYKSAQIETDLGFARHIRVVSIRDPQIIDRIRVRAGNAEFFSTNQGTSVFTAGKSSRTEITQQFAESDCSVTDGREEVKPIEPVCTKK